MNDLKHKQGKSPHKKHTKTPAPASRPLGTPKVTTVPAPLQIYSLATSYLSLTLSSYQLLTYFYFFVHTFPHSPFPLQACPLNAPLIRIFYLLLQ